MLGEPATCGSRVFRGTSRLVRDATGRVVVLLTLIVCGLVGCSTSNDGEKTAPASTSPSLATTAASSAEPTSSAGNQTPRLTSGYTVSKPDISSAARQVLGSGAADGTAAALEFAENSFYDDHCFVTAPGTDVESCAEKIGDAMTTNGSTDWQSSVDGFLSDAAAGRYGKSQSSGNVLSLTFYGALADSQKLDDGRRLAAPTTQHIFVNKKIFNVTSVLDNDGRLLVKLKASARAQVLINREPNLWPLTRHCTFHMIDVNGTWKVDGWHGGFHAGEFEAQ